ncbi:ABC transporter substrate-binding protein [Rhizobium sp. 16-488-2a]|uniref:ABC transporter substrate-binding protein n=1 Tax=Rhizobium sp. 16-488-2a TaxID=2819990 RepID=UPI001ADC8911|nr:ABC transporter substrate-binding protein [Rhizobium sp. 16-488-2b]MBO9177065.1 ABC transporter substrate-binding protein [Rhizobium sp. 16-488-2a]
MTVAKQRQPYPGQLTRRQFAAAFAAFMMPRVASAAPSIPKIAVLDWGWAESLVAIDVAPQAVAEAPLYGDRVVVPALPKGTVDLGLRSWPNMELLRSLQPDLILSQADYGVSQARLQDIAPTMALPLYTAEQQPLRRSHEALIAIGQRIGRSSAAEAFLDRSYARLAAIKAEMSAYDGRPLLIVKFTDDRVIDVYGAGSLFDDVLAKIGITNAWHEPTNNWGFATGGLDAIARYPEARLLIIEPGPPDAFLKSALWQSLPAVQRGDVATIPPTWVFGAFPSAMRFAVVLRKALGFA